VVLGIALTAAALLSLVAVPLYAWARATLQPLAAEASDETRPVGRRVGLAFQLGYTLVAVSSAALVPAVVFSAATLDRSAATLARARAEIAARQLARAAAGLEAGSATKLVTRTPLEGGERTLLRAPSGMLLPEEAIGEIAGMPHVEVPLEGALRGGTLLVAYPIPRRAHPVLVASVLLLLALTLGAAFAIARAAAEDAGGVARQIERIADGKEAPALQRIATAEVQALAAAVNRLLERIPRLAVASFLAIERANEAKRLKSQFLANMSHDLRSPLNSILGFSELLLRGLEGEILPGQRVTLAAMHATGLRLLRLLNEILDTAKVESGKMELHRQSAAPAELLRQASADARRGRAPRVSDRLTVELQPGLQPIYVDPLRVTQAVTHLVNYALDTATAGPIVLRVSAQQDTTTQGRTFVLELSFPGGLGDEEKAHLFDGFTQVPGKEGLHLALPLCRRIVEIHGGSVELDPDPPGATPTVRLRASLPVSAPRRSAA
jgi:signal transduction histidine kinase